jgi:hypothetical protein
LSIGDDQLGMTPQIPPEDTFIVAMYLTGCHTTSCGAMGRPVISQGYAPNSMRIVNLIEEYSANITCPHETLVFMYLRVVNDFAEESGSRRVSHFACQPGVIDPVMVHLGSVLLPAFQRPFEASALFIDHVTLAMLTHLCGSYGGDRPGYAVFEGRHDAAAGNPRQGISRRALCRRFVARRRGTGLRAVARSFHQSLSSRDGSYATPVAAAVSHRQG